MSGSPTLWTRWKDLARRAAIVQSNVLLWLLYYIVLVPIALLRRPFSAERHPGRPAWRERPGPVADRAAVARRQF